MVGALVQTGCLCSISTCSEQGYTTLVKCQWLVCINTPSGRAELVIVIVGRLWKTLSLVFYGKCSSGAFSVLQYLQCLAQGREFLVLHL